MDYGNAAVLVAAHETFHFAEPDVDARLLRFDHVEFASRVFRGELVFTTSPSILRRSCATRLHSMLKLLVNNQKQCPVWWACPFDWMEQLSVPALTSKVQQSEDLGLCVGDELLCVAEVMQMFDCRMAKQSTVRKFPPLDAFIPKTVKYVQAHVSATLAFMAVVRKLFDFRLFYGDTNFVTPDEAIRRMRHSVDMFVEDQCQVRSELKEVREAMLMNTTPTGLSMGEWYKPKTFLYCAGIVANPPTRSHKPLEILQRESDEDPLVDPVRRLLRMILSEWAATFLGAEYFDKELLDGVKASKCGPFKKYLS